MDKEKLMALVGVGLDETERLSQELGRPIDVDRSALVMLARITMHQPDGEDYPVPAGVPEHPTGKRVYRSELLNQMVMDPSRRTSTSTSPRTPTSGGRRGSSTPACPFCKPLARLTVGEETGVDRRGGMCYHEALGTFASGKRTSASRLETMLQPVIPCSSRKCRRERSTRPGKKVTASLSPQGTDRKSNVIAVFLLILCGGGRVCPAWKSG